MNLKHLTAIDDILPARNWCRRAWLIAVLWLLICLAATAPAQLLVVVLKPLVPQLQLHNVDGGFWRGSAAQAYWQQDGKVIALGKAEWQLNPWSLFWLHPSARVATHYGEQFFDARVRLSPLGSVALRDANAALPAQLLGLWLPLPARGQFALKIAAVDIARQQLRAVNGDVYWQQAQWQWGQRWLRLGDYRGALRMDKTGELHCALTGQGALAGSGDIGLDFNKKIWSADLSIKPEATLPEEFRQTITVMLAAKPDAQGQLHVQKNGSW
jgi:hypothetical protein